ncbi:hypothetical protein [Mesorhizobium sp. f-mel]
MQLSFSLTVRLFEKKRQPALMLQMRSKASLKSFAPSSLSCRVVMAQIDRAVKCPRIDGPLRKPSLPILDGAVSAIESLITKSIDRV